MKNGIMKILLAMFFMILVVSCGNKEEGKTGSKKYIIGTDTSFPPFEFKEGDKYTGIDIELIEAIAKLEGFEVEFKPMDFGGLIPALQSEQLDGVIAGASITEERKAAVDFSDPYYESGLVALVNKDNSSIKELKDLEGKKLAVKNGTAGAKFAEDNLKSKSEIRVYEDSASTLKAVENNQADAAFEDFPVIAYTIKVNPELKVKIGTDKLTTAEYGFMVKKGSNQELLEKFNKGMKTLKENGEYQKIVDKYTK